MKFEAKDREFAKNFRIIRTIYSNIERSEQFLGTYGIYLNFKNKSNNYRKINCFIIIQEIVKKHQNKKAPLIKKGFNCKKNRICFDPAHTQNVCMIKTGFACIKKGFSKNKSSLFFCKKEKKRTAVLPTVKKAPSDSPIWQLKKRELLLPLPF